MSKLWGVCVGFVFLLPKLWQAIAAKHTTKEKTMPNVPRHRNSARLGRTSYEPKGVIMIEKLGEYLCMETEDRIEDCKNKINELVDVVNSIQKEREAEWFEIKEWIGILEAVRKSVNVHEKQIDELQMKVEPEKCATPVDPYTEHQKWIGKLCKFWDYDGEEKWFSTLEHIDKNSPYPYCASGDWWYKHCEPVGLDDLIIYKGDKDE